MKDRFNEALLDHHREAINSENRRISEIFELLILCCTLALLGISTVRHEYGAMRIAYAVFAALSAGLLVFTHVYGAKHPRLVPKIVIAVMLEAYAYCVLSGIVFNLHAPSITVYSVMVAACAAYMLPFSFTVLFHLAAGAVYCTLALLLKPEYGVQDTINYVLFLLMSFVLTAIIHKSRLAYLDSLDAAVRREQENERLLNDIPGGVGIFDIAEGHATQRYMNDAYYRMLGDTREARSARTGGNFMNGVAKEQHAVVLRAILALIGGQDHVDFSYKALMQDGKTMWLRLEGNAVKREGRHIVVFCSFSNVTEMYQQLEDQLRKTSSALELAQRANDEKAEFYARMSHDMRTPMNGILGMTELSKDEDDLNVLRHNISMIESSGKYMLSLINDSLDMQRIENGRLSLNPEVCNAGRFVENIVAMITPTADQKGVDFEVVNENIDVNCFVRIDAVRFKQIFMNLLSNAVKFTPAGGHVEVQMRCLEHTPERDRDEFKIIDDGVGMSREYLTHSIFNAYSQETNQMSGQYAGSGLGLAITRSLVELMGGKIEVESELGKGTTFTLTFDIELATPDDVRASAQEISDAAQPKNDILNGRRVLLCEDHTLNAEIAARLLARRGMETEHAENGQAGLEMFKRAEPDYYDAVLMDIRMPVMDGLTAAAAIRALPRADARRVPIIAMTANAYPEDVQRTMDAGMDAHLSKPIEPKRLYGTLEELISEPRQLRCARILIVDDSEINRAVARESLADFCEVSEAADGQEALALIHKQPFDLVVTDIQMPVMGGIELIRHIRADHAYDSLRIIANTQLGEPEQEDALINLGANDFVFKPNSPRVLRLRVQNLLK